MPQKGIDGELLLAVGAGELWRVLAILWTNHDRQRPGRRAATSPRPSISRSFAKPGWKTVFVAWFAGGT